ncbi:RNA polymerase sigma-70 factor, ECF subfamily [Loktanella fryxellensis]|uniref:RNA polymerase sigma-70 factor, ECF subfamily n=1 Tax=Loktanella fryxellensis TaxID=245187 RepID=A0A1H7Z610_9RHOB|nr:sigma-70 family RNA polymerase sigma factor [Loktanella fryxellensis]SEM52907.1 RNA polymerase sigma-70 factor, ECF subfamily [Loktanella fryxellensis]
MTTTADIENMIARTALGDRAAFEGLYAATSAKLFGVCLRVLGNRAEAEDALQEAFVKIWRNADRYRVNGLSPMTWLITVTRNHAVDKVRARRALMGAGLDEAAEIPDSAPGPEALAVASATRGRIDDCMGQLDPDKAGAVRRAYLDGHTYQELADHYDVPLNTVRTWLRRSLLKLRECLSHDG